MGVKKNGVALGKTARLTKKKAQDLIKRELGISAAALEKPPSMNGNPSFPCFELCSGSTTLK